MGCRILGEGEECCFYDTVTMFAFGPVDSKEELERFWDWLDVDPRSVINIYEKWQEFQEKEDD